MNLSAILVVALPGQFDALRSQLAAVPGVDIHYEDRSSNRYVCTIEAPDVHSAADRFTEIRSLPGTADASLLEERDEAC